MTTGHANSPEVPDAPDALGGLGAQNARFFALIPCAGHGSRAGTALPKQYQVLAGEVMVRHTVQAFRALGDALAGIWVVVSPDDLNFQRVFPDFGQERSEKLLHQGGATRAATVLAGLQALLAESAAQPGDWVLVHDAARCLITPAQISRLIAACRNDAVGGLLALPLPDTLKSASAGRVHATLERSDKWLAQTPQMFRMGALIAALQAAGAGVTDESSAIEASGLSPLLVAGSAQNFKVTFADDLPLAAALLQSRRHPDSSALNPQAAAVSQKKAPLP